MARFMVSAFREYTSSIPPPLAVPDSRTASARRRPALLAVPGPWSDVSSWAPHCPDAGPSPPIRYSPRPPLGENTRGKLTGLAVRVDARGRNEAPRSDGGCLRIGIG